MKWKKKKKNLIHNKVDEFTTLNDFKGMDMFFS